MTSTPQTDAMPVRRREVLELMDLSIKLYRRNFWLVAFSAVCTAFSFGGFLLYFFVAPFAYGPAACAIAAAVRGQSVGFGDAWRFTTRRYGALLGQIFLSYILCGFIFSVLIFAGIMGFAGLVMAIESARLPSGLEATIYAFAVILALALFSIVGAIGTAAICMAPMIACLEEDQRHAAIARTFTLLNGNVWRAILLYSLLGLSALVFMAMLGGGLAAIAGIPAILDAFRGQSSDSSLALAFMSMAVLWGLVTLLWQPFVYLLSGLFCLDLRVRREALDLEWQAHLSSGAGAPPRDGQSPQVPLGGAGAYPAQPAQPYPHSVAAAAPGPIGMDHGAAPASAAVPPPAFGVVHAAAEVSTTPGGSVDATLEPAAASLWQDAATAAPGPASAFPGASASTTGQEPARPQPEVGYSGFTGGPRPQEVAAQVPPAVPAAPSASAPLEPWSFDGLAPEKVARPIPPEAGPPTTPLPSTPLPAPPIVSPLDDEPEDYPVSSFGGSPRP